MGFEKPESLDDVLRRLGAAVEKNEKNIRNFDTENGFRANLSFSGNNDRELLLKRDGLTSTFAISGDEITFISLRGPDGEHIQNTNFVDKHKQEAEKLLQEDRLEETERFDADEDGQYNLL